MLYAIINPNALPLRFSKKKVSKLSQYTFKSAEVRDVVIYLKYYNFTHSSMVFVINRTTCNKIKEHFPAFKLLDVTLNKNNVGVFFCTLVRLSFTAIIHVISIFLFFYLVSVFFVSQTNCTQHSIMVG